MKNSSLSQRSRIVPSLPDLIADLEGLEQDFVAVCWDRSTQVLSVTTEPITLEGIELGPFEIQLHCCELQAGQASPYRVVALEPNPASCNDEVTHPHVQCNSLCEGDGRQAIAAVLAQGRLHDFFTVVASLLRTYNDGSPYVGLDEWGGVNCEDCGDLCAAVETVTCGPCSATICGDCSDHCSGCEESTCRSCLTDWSVCHDSCCSVCLSTCVDCQANCCSACLTDSERCPDCHEKQEVEEEFKPLPADEPLPADWPTAPLPGAAVRSDRVGQAAVPA